MSRCAGVLFAALTALPGRAAAQDVPALRARIARLERAVAAAEATARRTDSLERATLQRPRDTVTAGALRVLVPAGVIAQARPAAARTWVLLDSTFGTGAQMLTDRVFTLVVMRGDEIPKGGPVAHAVLATVSESDIAQRLLWAAANAIAERSDSALREWIGGALIPGADPAREPRSVYVALVTAPSPAARRCYTGDLGACRVVLGFLPATDAVVEWYDAPRWRELVRGLDNLEQVGSVPRLAHACVVDGSDPDCLAILRRVPPRAIPPPLPPAARFSVVRHALVLGGRGAYARLVGSAGRPVAERLAAASGMPADSLLAAWHAAVMAARPRPVTVEPRGAWAALAWGAMFGLLALRSSRWR
jgi:hypothetical protein